MKFLYVQAKLDYSLWILFFFLYYASKGFLTGNIIIRKTVIFSQYYCYTKIQKPNRVSTKNYYKVGNFTDFSAAVGPKE